MSQDTATLDERFAQALSELPSKERRGITHAPYRPCLDALAEELHDGEVVRAVSCAVNSHLGRGVVALTGDRVVFCCTRSGASSWALDEIDDVEGRTKSFTLPAAVTLHTHGERVVFALGVGRRSAAAFVAAVSAAVPATSGVAA
jgi:hypothetical protein